MTRLDLPPWTLESMPDLGGRRALVSGGSGGLGYATARELARAGAEVVVAGRDPSKVARAVESLEASGARGGVHRLWLDLADLSSVRRAAAEAAAYGSLDVLVHSTGSTATPTARTLDGFDLQLGTHHFGAFALTGLLMPALVASGNGRVVTVSSQAHRLTRTAPLENPRVHTGRRHYRSRHRYAQAKLANLLFTFELERRLRDAGLPVRALAVHPGRQPADRGAHAPLMAATADVPGGIYLGPTSWFQTRGTPGPVAATRLARDRDAQRRLWEISQDATGLAYP